MWDFYFLFMKIDISGKMENSNKILNVAYCYFLPIIYLSINKDIVPKCNDL